MKYKIDISILIVNYKVEKELLECIDSIYKSKPKAKFEIIVIDNDEIKLIGKKIKNKFPKVKYIENENNIGYGAGNNIGAKIAEGEYLLILNPDTLLLNNTLDILLVFIKKNLKIGVVAPLLIDKHNMPYELQGTRELTPKRAIFSLSFLDKLLSKNKISNEYWYRGWDKSKNKEVDVVPGTAFLIKKNLFEKIGGFDKNFFLFFEEFDLCNRLKKIGYRNFIISDAKVFHKWGASTLKNSNSDNYFKSSRLYYFKKNYGLPSAFITEFILRLNKENIILSLIIFLAIFLRLYILQETLAFIGDFSWFYLSARDMILSHQIPLVGITSSHLWLHQGAFWTYILGIVLWLSHFNPFVPAYFTSLVDVITLILIYYLTKNLFNKKIALISSLFYATSPYVIAQTIVPYHTSLIPFFTVLFLISIYKWIKGGAIFFPISISLIAILYNFEIATTVLTITLCTFLFFSFIKRKKWALNILNPKIIFLSITALLIPMIPMLVYDLSHGFSQTLKVIVWMSYRVAILFGYPEIHPNAPAENWQTFSSFLFVIIQKFYFIRNKEIALIIFLIVSFYAIYKIFKTKFKDINLILIFIFFAIPLASYIAAKTNSEAYVLIFFPQAVILVGYFFGSFKNKFISLFLIILLGLIVILNSTWYIANKKTKGLDINYYINAANWLVKDANGRSYNLIGKGKWSQYESFTASYDYLAWWLGNGPSKKDQKLKYYVSELNNKIKIEKK